MGLRKLRVNTTYRPARGFKDAATCLELLKNNWDQIIAAFGATSEEEQEELIAHFNEVAEEVGDVLFGEDMNDFVSKIEGLNDEEQKSFVVALKEAELIVVD